MLLIRALGISDLLHAREYDSLLRQNVSRRSWILFGAAQLRPSGDLDSTIGVRTFAAGSVVPNGIHDCLLFVIVRPQPSTKTLCADRPGSKLTLRDVTADFDGDGRNDLVASTSGTSTSEVFIVYGKVYGK